MSTPSSTSSTTVIFFSSSTPLIERQAQQTPLCPLSVRLLAAAGTALVTIGLIMVSVDDKNGSAGIALIGSGGVVCSLAAWVFRRNLPQR